MKPPLNPSLKTTILNNPTGLLILVGLLLTPPLLAATESANVNQVQPETPSDLETVTVKQTDLNTSTLAPSAKTVNVINQIQLERLAPTKIEEVVTYLPNVQSNRLGAGIGEDFIVRGFGLGGRLLLDGVLDNQSYYIRDPATIERVEIIKGHDSVLFGTGAPGGSVNFVAKKPQQDATTEISVGMGSFNNQRWVLDSTGPISESGNLTYRSVFALQKGDTWKDNVENESLTLMNSVDWAYAPKSHVLATWEFSQQGFPYDFDNVYANGKPVYNVSYVHPETEADRQYHRLSLDFEHFITEQAWLEAKFNAIQGQRDERQIGFFYLVSDNDPLIGYYREVDETFEQTNVRLALHQTYQIGQAEHELTLGFENNTTDADFDNRRAVGAFSLDIYNPQFDFELPNGADLPPRVGFIEWNEQAWFVQNSTQIHPQLEFRLGFRSSQYELESQRNDFVLSKTQEQALSKSMGLSWFAQPNLELYASYSDSFLPNVGMDRSGNFFDAISGQQKEVGLTYQNRKHGIDLNLALFDIQQSNLLTKDPVDPTYKILAGEKRVKGTELQMRVAVTNKLDFNVSAGLLNPKLSENNDGYQGNDFPSVPKKTASLSLAYQLTPSIKTFVGAVHQGKRAGDLANSFYVDAYTRYDAAVKWQINPKMAVNLSVQNLTDINYITYATAQDFVRFGNPRTWMLLFSSKL